MNVGIVAQKGNTRATTLAEELREQLSAVDASVTLDEATGRLLGLDGRPVEALGDCDLIVSIGGDGTFLFAASGADGTPILGVNLGEVGFLNAVGPDDAVDAVLAEVAAVREGDQRVRVVPRLVAVGDGWRSDPATNEIVVQGGRRGRGGGVDLEVRIDGSLYTSGHADGLLVSTPTGSTAYNLSERGPLVHPSVGGLVVNEMCPDEGMPPLLVAPDATVTVTVTAVGRRDETDERPASDDETADDAVVVSDGKHSYPVSPPTEVEIRRAETPLRIAGPSSDFFEALNKLD
ncbi:MULTISPECIES: NAD(+)/NADH kinase [Haloprofundus]|uniref:NAD(+)/NADH kinase n=1 Tax=Haloprofundus TaxID=1911573 RepID=UPI000E441C6E|nr:MULTISPECIES: NAD(+)/NADH kinase [Haloprofundus]QCJ46221.1 NAD(+)/NADH kinase [Haloprofundus sp. MHR1]